MHPLLKAVGMWIPPIGRLAADRDALHAQCTAVGIELSSTRAELAAVRAELARAQRKSPFWPFRLADVERDAAEPEQVAGALTQHQMCLVRGALPAERCAALRHKVEAAMASTAGGTLAKLFGTDREVLLHVLASPCLAAARSHFRTSCGTDDILVLPLGLVARKFVPSREPSPSALPFHQDAFGFPPRFNVVNCWTLLSPQECGETAPGLEFVPDGLDSFLGLESAPRSVNYGFLETPHDLLARYLATYDPWRPSIRLGDVMMFTKYALHRTALHTGQHQARYSAEIRLVANTPETAAYLREHPAGAIRVAELLP